MTRHIQQPNVRWIERCSCGFGRLAEIAHALLKLAPYDTLTMESRGLRRYVMEMLPITDWSSEAVRPALILILKRLDRMFNKIHKMPTLRCARPQALCTRSVDYNHFFVSPCECIVFLFR